MTDLGHISNLAGAHYAPARSAPAAPPAPATVHNAVSPPLVAPQNAVTQPPIADAADGRRRLDPAADPRLNARAAAPSLESLAATLDHLNQRLRDTQTNLKFTIDDEYQQIVVRIVDRETQEVVRQIPSETAMALAKAFEDLELQNQPPASSAGALEGWLLQATA